MKYLSRSQLGRVSILRVSILVLFGLASCIMLMEPVASVLLALVLLLVLLQRLMHACVCGSG